MAKVNVGTSSDGESASIGLKKQKESSRNFNVRLDAFAGKEDLNPEDCPKSMVPMLCGQNTRVACTTGNSYIFAANKVAFVHERDADTCGGRGAVKQDAAAIAERKQVAADKAELLELREEKAAKKAAAAAKAAPAAKK
jgi:hypothetical protein